MDCNRLVANLLRLVEVPSISESPAEREMPFLIRKMLLEIEYFRSRPGNIRLLPVKGDPWNRQLVTAFLEGNGSSRNTVVLLSHYDVVGTTDYGKLAGYAFCPLELAKKLEPLPLPPEVETDLESGEYLFGRGIMDMKYGIALHIELMRQVSTDLDSFPGNILFISVPDEEANSLGMLSTVGELLHLKAGGLNLVGAINSEPDFPRYPGDQNRYIYTGTVGKLLPLILCRGQATHAGEPFAGLNPNLMLSEVVRTLELNPLLAGRLPGVPAPPPVCLKMCDLKAQYSVQTPVAAYAYFNLITTDKSPREVMDLFKTTVRKALLRLNDQVSTSARLWASELGWEAPSMPAGNIPVYSLIELLSLCARATGRTPEQLAQETYARLTSTDLREATVEYICQLLESYPEKSPLVVVAFAPPYYPHNSLTSSYADRLMAKVADQVVDRAQAKHCQHLIHAPFFPALSDMSYLKLSSAPDLDYIAANTPVWGPRYRVPLEEISQLALPFINIGPLGKDAHKFTERLNLPYSLQVTPDLVNYAIHLLVQQP